MRAALYTRVSTRDKGQETANQIRQLRGFSAAQGWPIVAEYEDHESGAKADLAQFRAMMAAASQRRFDVVVVWALDRFSREGVGETFDQIRRLSSDGVQFVSFSEAQFRTTGPAGELMIAMAAWIAKQERIRISERVRAGLSRAGTQGTRSGNPIGRPKVIFDRARAVELRRAGRSWRDIARACGVGVTTVRRVCRTTDDADSGLPKPPA
jgi:DNA invertase Pin-like site-specific DNA recombinase